MSGPAALSRPPRSTALLVALVGVGLYAALVAVLACTHGGSAEWFVKFGRDSHVTDEGRRVLGEDLVVPFDEAHDGTTFWVLARDPLLWHPEETTDALDRPGYRAQRIAYPAIAAPSRLLGEQALLWGLVVTNLAVIGTGTYLASRLAQTIGAPAAAGLAFAANPVVLVAVVLDLSEAMMIAAVVATVLFVRWDRWGWATVAATVAVLAKEPALAAVAALAVGAAGRPVRIRSRLVLVPAVVAGTWALYARWRLGWPSAGIEELTAVPFDGFRFAWQHVWAPTGRWADASVAGLVVLVAAVTALRWWRRRSLELWAALPGALMVPFLTSQVVNLGLNSIRVLGPTLTLVALDWYAGTAEADAGLPSPAAT